VIAVPTSDSLTFVRTRAGARLEHAGHVVSQMRATPGPTHSLFDLMAACVSTLAPGPHLALLGFGGGSIVAPLRALGWDHPIDAVDLSIEATLAYSRVAGAHLGDVCVTLRDAAAWLRSQRKRFDAIVEDLSLNVPGDLVMPPVCFDPLPKLIAARLTTRGVALVNVFSPGPLGWNAWLRRLVPAGLRAVILEPDDFDHRLLLLSRHLPDAHTLSTRIRATLHAIRSRQASRFALRTLLRRKGVAHASVPLD
jgi:hypothetical protein